MVLRAAFALALVCLVPIREPDIGLPRPPRDCANEFLAGLRQRIVPDLARAAAEIRLAGMGDMRLPREGAPSFDPKALLRKLRAFDDEAPAVIRDPSRE